MFHQTQYNNPAGSDEVRFPAKFIAVCILTFIAGIIATVYFFRSMSIEMEMPGGWTMSMMWMRMPDQTWFMSALSFLLMWLAMMIAMMMPSALPMFLRTQRRWSSLCFMASGYFAVWMIAGIGVYIVGVVFATVAMRSELLSHAAPLLSGASLIIAGTIQFTRWKLTHIFRCRSLFGCTVSCPQYETSFRLGCKQGAACCVCCATLMTVQLVLGIMNLFVMIVIAILIAAEKLLLRPEIIARLAGIVAIFSGITMSIHWIMLNCN